MGNTKSKESGPAIAAAELGAAAHHAKDVLDHQPPKQSISEYTQTTPVSHSSPGKSFYQTNSPDSIHSNSPNDIPKYNHQYDDVLAGNTPGTTV